MKVKNLWRIYVIVIVLCVIAAVCATIVFLRSASADHNTLDNLITFVVTILSMLVALLAYHISVKTYISIDAVNAISRMDGNVMENENYRTSIISIVRKFDDADKVSASNRLIGELEKKFSGNVTSGAKLADNIQQTVDVIVLLSFIVRRKNSVEKSAEDFNSQVINRFDRLLDRIENKVKDLEQMSEGSCILILESVKLLRAVYAYQCYKSGEWSKERVALLMDVRGAMLKNSISRTVYYNYMGLMYLDKAMISVRNFLGEASQFDVLSIDAAKKMRRASELKKNEQVLIYLREAITDFERAAKTIEDELMWNAFIRYNMARAQYLLSLILDLKDGKWAEAMDIAVDYRFKLSMMLNDAFGKEDVSFFQRIFADELRLAQLMRIRLRIAFGMDVEISEELLDVGDDELLNLTRLKRDILANGGDLRINE